MIRLIAVFALSSCLFGSLALARPDVLPHDTRLWPAEGPTPWLRVDAPSSPAKAAVDTLYVLGGPDRLDGTFETADGAPDWHGWTHRDGRLPSENHWHVSQYWAYSLNGHGAGNHALVCVDEEIPACSEADTIGGVAPGMFDDIEWVRTVEDPGVSTTVRLTGWMHYDLVDVDWDFLELHLLRAGNYDMLGSWTGSGDNVALDISATLTPGEYDGESGDEVRFVWRVWSDSGYDDLDCLSPSHGAAQIDDISVFFGDSLITFDDFEPGSEMNWALRDFSGVGDFTHLRAGLGDLDPCKQNTSVQVTFIDDGKVVPGAGPTYCDEYCYGHDNYVLNHTGGLLADDPNQDWFLRNEVFSPPIAWPAGHDGAQLEFDVYRHEDFSSTSPGIFFFWYVRSSDSADPADLELAAWKSRGFVFYGTPDYQRFVEPVSDLIVPGAQWAQIMLGVDEMGWMWNVNGTNGTPAPYFDNVALKAWVPEGPEILVDSRYNFQDGFPTQGTLDAADLGSNSCRVDAAIDVDYDELIVAAGDSLLAEITPLRKGAVLAGPGQLHWVMLCNPVFDEVRPATPGAGGILRGSVSGEDAYDRNGYLREQYRAFDLPDEGFLFPGDRLRYYIVAGDDLDGDVKMSTWPADTTGVLDFSVDSPYPDFAEISGLPHVGAPVAGEFPHARILLWDETGGGGSRARWLRSLTELGFVEGVDYDHLRMRGIGKWSSLGIDASATAATLDGYDTVLLAAGTNGNTSVSGDVDVHADELLIEWLDLGGKNLLLAGDSLLSSLTNYPESSLRARVGVVASASDISRYNGGYRDLRINPIAGNGILPDAETWAVNALCPASRFIDGVEADSGTVTLATLDPAASLDAVYAAALARTDTLLANRIAMLPFDLAAVETAHENPHLGEPNFSARTLLLKYLLDWMSESGSGPYTAVPGAKAITLRAAPNPFNPRTMISFELPRAMAVRLDIYDVQGRRVRRLVEEELAAGSHSRVWNGRDGRGRTAPSGIYFYRFDAGTQRLQGKLTLLK